MKKLMWICFSVLVATLCSASQPEIKAYKGQRFQVAFSYPDSWLLEGETAGDNLLSLYSPEAVSTRKDHVYLVLGIKTELYLSEDLEDEEIKKLTECTAGKKAPEFKPTQHKISQCYYDDDIFIVATLLQGEKEQVLIIGYIPEDDKINHYLPSYHQVVNSFAFLPKDVQ